MIKKLGKRKLTTMILAGFMSLLTLIGGAGFVSRPAKAATAETNAITADSIKDISEYSKKVIGWNTDISGKLIYWHDINNRPGDIDGWCLQLTNELVFDVLGNMVRVEDGGAEATPDNTDAFILKLQKNESGQNMGMFIYCSGEVVTFNDGAYSFDPKNGLLPDACSVSGETRCRLRELEDRTGTSKYIESEYTLGTPITGYVRFKAEAVAETGSLQFYKGDKETFISLDFNDESIYYWGSSVDVPETLDGAYVVNRGETFVDVYFENEITIEMIQTEGYTVHTLTALSTSGGNGSHISGGSSISGDKMTKKAQDLSPAELIGLIAIIALELIGAATYILKAPNSKYKWIILIGLLIISAGLDIWTYLRFTGII